jgi:magnesium chelatase family protein
VPLLPQGTLAASQVGHVLEGESSKIIKNRVLKARGKQLQRQGKLNNALSTQEIASYCRLSLEDAKFLELAINQMGLSIRAWHSLLKVARSIADLAESEKVERHHLTESLAYRAMDRLLKNLSL